MSALGNKNAEAYLTLRTLAEDWATEHDDLVKRPDTFAQHLVDFAFDELLMISVKDINTKAGRTARRRWGASDG